MFFVRNNGIPPEKSTIDLDKWTLTIAGESVKKQKKYTLKTLKNNFKNYTYHLVAVSQMQYSIDFGATWQSCQLSEPVNRFAWQHFSARIKFPAKGYYEVWAKATDGNGVAQPMILPGWNPKGYLNNACHRIAVKII